ncbi:ABC-type transport auxiliary lipoprotein family protein [Rhodanobacter sp. OR444]|uniref:ABC-type transport auxiliary lipoprotein family protein n=1 Tax=Rhodanobacter sp. OR444 TaxID=1076525 RepID=UPI0003F976AA|nr:ABC-type transport auxiliary lipoprotein family protein [Rhodanobacter sp. OR444]
MRPWLSCLLLPIFLLALSGCGLLPPHAAPPRYHDFGPPTTEQPANTVLYLREVSAPAWLDSGEIQYRLLMTDPTQVRAYATGRWIAAPSRLLAQRLREQLPGKGSPHYGLRVELDRFEQDFDTADHARVVMQVHAMITTADGATVAAHDFTFSTPTTPDISGAITGLAALAQQATEAILAWSASVSQGGEKHGT